MDNLKLERSRSLDIVRVRPVLIGYSKGDVRFFPKLSNGTTRRHAAVVEAACEILCAGPGGFDARVGLGTAGVIDMICHFRRLPFKQGERLLPEGGL